MKPTALRSHLAKPPSAAPAASVIRVTVDRLNAAASDLATTDIAKAVELASEAIDLAARLHYSSGEAKGLLTLAIGDLQLFDYSQAAHHADAARERFERLGDQHHLALSLQHLCIAYRYLGKLPDALHAAYTGLALAAALDNTKLQGAFLNLIANTSAELNDYATALDYQLRALSIWESLGLEDKQAVSLTNLGNIYEGLGRLDTALTYQLRSLDVQRRLHSREGLALTLGNLGLVYMSRGEYLSALPVMEESLELNRSLGNRHSEAIGLVNLANVNLKLGRRKESKRCYDLSLALRQELGDRNGEAYCLAGFGDIACAEKKLHDALQHFSKALLIAEACQDKRLMRACYEALSDISAETGNPEAALDSFRKFHHIEKEISGEAVSQRTRSLEIRYEVDRLQKEREILSLKAAQLEHSVTQKQKELVTLAMSLVAKNEFLSALRGHLSTALGTASGATKASLTELVRRLDTAARSEEEWKTFEAEFAKVHEEFIHRLSERHPNLSPTELKICALLKINLSTKDIAKLLSCSTRNVENHRFRIRTKLRLAASENLSSFLVKL